VFTQTIPGPPPAACCIEDVDCRVEVLAGMFIGAIGAGAGAAAGAGLDAAIGAAAGAASVAIHV